jgi:hypothetical protein
MKVKTRQYGNEVLKLVKKKLPKIYNQFIKGKRDAFIDGNKPIEAKFWGEGKKVGHVPKDLQMLWALGKMFHQLADTSFVLRKKMVGGPLKACLAISDIAMNSLGNECIMLLWWVVAHRRAKSQGFLVIQSDWSITRESFEGLPPDQIEGIKICKYEEILFLIELNIAIIGLAMYTKSCAKSLEKKYKELLSSHPNM